MNNLYQLPGGIDYTDQQKDAIFKEGTNILVSAAAGCGKTTLMVERIVRKVLQDRVPINTLVVVTFTEVAASELKERLEKALQERLVQMPEQSDFINQQLALLNEAYIMTFHALCFRLLQENHLNFKFDDKIKISSGLELDSAKLNSYQQFYEKHCLTDDFLILDEYYNASLTNKDKLYELLQKVITIAHNNGGFARLQRTMRETGLSLNNHPLFTPLLKAYLTYHTQSIIQSLQTIIHIENTPQAEKHAHQHLALFQGLQLLIDDFNFDKIVAYIKEIKFARNNKHYVQEEAKTIYTSLKKVANDHLQKVFVYDEVTELKVYHYMDKHAQILLKYAQLFDETFRAFKIKRGLLEFSDLETYTLELLYQTDGAYSATALQLQGYFKEIMIDEYQDTNSIQEKIVDALSHDNQFMVGDVKQSIYRFRNATSEIFTDKYLAYQNGIGGTIINLNTNFRSRPEVLALTNFVFKNIFSQALGGLAYDEQAALHFGNTSLLTYQGNFKSELLINLPEHKNSAGSKDIISNSKMIVQKIKELIKTGVHYQDIAILYRNRTNIPFLEQTLADHQIPYMNHGGSGFYKITQITDLINFLNVLVNPDDEVCLLSVLKSYFFHLDDEALLDLRLDHNTLFLSIKALYPAIYETIVHLRQLSHSLNIIELIDQIYALTDYEAYLQDQVNYQTFMVNLNAFKDIIVNNYDYFNSLEYFVSELTTNIKSGFDEATPAIISSKQDVVNMMSIHKAKGLEFKYVFILCDSKIIDRGAAVGHIDNQLIIDYFNEVNRTKDTKHLFKKLYQFNELTKEMAEELRILYVALTRAQLKLFLVFNTTQDKISIIQQQVAHETTWELPHTLVLGIKNYGELLLLALLRHKNHQALITGCVNNADEAIINYEDDLYQVTRFQLSNEVTTSSIKAIYDQTTTLKKTTPFDHQQAPTPKLKPSLHNTSHLLDFNQLNDYYAYQQGNRTHQVLELLDFKSPTLLDDIEKLAHKYELTIENKQGIMAFVQSTYFPQIIEKNYYQEYHFTTYLDKQLTTGVIDLLVEDEYHLYVIDYKTDRLSNEALVKQYQKQLKIYQKALANYSDKDVKLYLYSIKNQEYVAI
jgi:ATP-dependent helicase/nuclease subunit A